MNRAICVINGKGGAGKDTLISSLGKGDDCIDCLNVSSIDPIKDICCQFNKNGEKDLAYRKLLADTKKLVDDYCKETNGIGYTDEYLLREVKDFIGVSKADYSAVPIMFVHIREPENIRNFVEMTRKECMLARDKDTNIVTLLVKSDREKETYGNSADDFVDHYPYDFIYKSRGDIQQDGERFKSIIRDYVLDDKVRYYDKPVIDDKNCEVIVGKAPDETELACGVMLGNVNPRISLENGQLLLKLPQRVQDKAQKILDEKTKDNIRKYWDKTAKE